MSQYNNWQTDFSSSLNVNRLFFDNIKQNKPNFEAMSVEESSDIICQWMDKFAGIDWITKENGTIMTWAVRNQWMLVGQKPYNTFTIRSARGSGTKTEYQKRCEAIQKGFMYPQLTLQSYYEKETNRLLSYGIILTKNLYSFCESHPDLVYVNCSDNEFKYVRWKDLQNNNVKFSVRNIEPTSLN